jgi:Cu/Ag efflux protein CusF
VPVVGVDDQVCLTEATGGGAMQKLMMATAAAALGLTAMAWAAQSKTIPVKMEVISATVEAVDRAARQVTVKKEDGNHEVFYVPPSVKRFDALKVGDRITGRHYEKIVLQVKAPGEKDVDTTVRDVATPASKGTGGTLAHQRTITATITAIDQNAPSITFTGPQGFNYSSRVQDKAALAKVKVGDKVDITWTEAVMLSIDDVK